MPQWNRTNFWSSAEFQLAIELGSGWPTWALHPPAPRNRRALAVEVLAAVRLCWPAGTERRQARVRPAVELSGNNRVEMRRLRLRLKHGATKLCLFLLLHAKHCFPSLGTEDNPCIGLLRPPSRTSSSQALFYLNTSRKYFVTLFVN